MAKIHKVSPFAPPALAELPPIPGVRLAVAEAGIKYSGRTDVLLALFPEGTQAGGVLTRSKTASAPVDWCRAQLQHGEARALVVNSGNANAFTGWRGAERRGGDGEVRGGGGRVRTGAGVHCLDRGHRRAARRIQI